MLSINGEFLVLGSDSARSIGYVYKFRSTSTNQFGKCSFETINRIPFVLSYSTCGVTSKGNAFVCSPENQGRKCFRLDRTTYNLIADDSVQPNFDHEAAHKV